MIIKLVPQVRDSNKIWYELEEDTLTISMGDVTETFDFKNVPNGELRLRDEKHNPLIETDLPDIPILSAVKGDGELEVEILFSISPKENDERLLFPKPMTLEEFKELMQELQDRGKRDKKSYPIIGEGIIGNTVIGPEYLEEIKPEVVEESPVVGQSQSTYKNYQDPQYTMDELNELNQMLSMMLSQVESETDNDHNVEGLDINEVNL